MNGFVLKINEECCSSVIEEGQNIGFTIVRFLGSIKLYLNRIGNGQSCDSEDLYFCELKLGDKITFELKDVVEDSMPEVNVSDDFDSVDDSVKDANLLRRYLALKAELLSRGCQLD